jgi:hypothetical protein
VPSRGVLRETIVGGRVVVRLGPILVTEPPKILGPPTAVLVPRTLDSHADAPNSLTGPSACIFFHISQHQGKSGKDYNNLIYIEKYNIERVIITIYGFECFY